MFAWLTILRDHDSFPNPSVFVDNGAPSMWTVVSDAKRWSARLRFPGFCLIKACPHQDRVVDRGAAFDHAPNRDDRPVDARIGTDAAAGDNHPLNLRSSDPPGRQYKPLAVDWINAGGRVLDLQPWINLGARSVDMWMRKPRVRSGKITSLRSWLRQRVHRS